MGSIPIDRASWPEDGRIGRITAGEYAGLYLLLAVEINDSWAFYISEDPRVGEADQLEADDFWATDEDTPALVEEMAVVWADESQDAELEMEIFDIRGEWHRRRRGNALIRSVFRRPGRRD
ncbi:MULTISPECIES: hypothetical protein [Streptomyces]|uniref:Uncharacterized protein n=1 Tax=Streptomyces zinciresistens K42 TaxID=700597 RepID=G2G5Y4_9ACTN|nr:MULTISPECIES: hypothetical protein [Streptomyces]EGX61073.1 hypothetical protein SZN_04451 [Streptomyces zinciresistens K42]MDT9696597.1 hypothetical protein [Streptomyces sp. P17]